MEIREHVLLAPYTVFKIGGPARYFCEVATVEELQEAFSWASGKSLPYVVLGAGSNVLVSDTGFSGLAIRMALREIRKEKEHDIYFGAGVSMASAVSVSIAEGRSGFEWGVGIPGTIGGSVYGNAGCFGGEMKDVVESVEVFDSQTAKNYKLSTINCEFGYRNSIFKKHPEWIIVGASLQLVAGDSTLSRQKVLEYTKKRTASQDIGTQCAGCIFKNPAHPAGYLIDTAGLKGARVGAAMVSNRHANYIINTGGATARDVRALIGTIKEKVKQIHGVELEEEIRYI